ncbi:alpha/beta hydrolase [Mycolicibacterium boenickei]
MALPALVLVHGGGLAGDCWEPTVDEIQRRAAEITVLVVDLPGRRGKAGTLQTATIADWVSSVVADIDDAGLDNIVIVAHSLAGVTVPGVVTKLGASKVRELILATAFVPPEGKTVRDTLPGLGGLISRRFANRNGTPNETPRWFATYTYMNGMSHAQRIFALDRLYPESSRILVENVTRRGMPDEVPRTWILTRRDRALPVKSQRKSIDAIGGVQTIIEMDTCHALMISEPELLAEILVERCRQYA